MKMDVSDFGNLRTLRSKISLAHKSSGGKWLYMRESLEGVDKLANVGLLLLGKVSIIYQKEDTLTPFSNLTYYRKDPRV